MYKIEQGKKQAEPLSMKISPETDVNGENRQMRGKG